MEKKLCHEKELNVAFKEQNARELPTLFIEPKVSLLEVVDAPWMDILFTPVEKLSNEDKTICFGMRVLLEIEAIDILTPVFLKQLQFANT